MSHELSQPRLHVRMRAVSTQAACFRSSLGASDSDALAHPRPTGSEYPGTDLGSVCFKTSLGDPFCQPGLRTTGSALSSCRTWGVDLYCV